MEHDQGYKLFFSSPQMVADLRAAFPGRELVFKIGRFSPDKRWNMAMDALADEKRTGHDVAAVIRGGQRGRARDHQPQPGRAVRPAAANLVRRAWRIPPSVRNHRRAPVIPTQLYWRL